MARDFSEHACNSGLRSVTDAFADAHRKAVAQAIGSLDMGLVWSDMAHAIFKERGMPLDPTWSDDAISGAVAALVRKAMLDYQPDDDAYEAGLHDVGQALDEYVEEARQQGEESGFGAGQEAAYEDAYAQGREDAEAEREDAPKCPTCMAAAICAHPDTGRAHCERCSTDFALIDARTLDLLRMAAHEPVTRDQYLRGCGLESAPLSASEER